MKTLTNYRKNGYDFTVVHRDGNFAVAQEHRHGSCEVFIVQSHNGITINGKYIEPAEYVPGNNQWGTLGWTLPNIQSAMAKVESLAVPF
jgi:hypothetical protein